MRTLSISMLIFALSFGADACLCAADLSKAKVEASVGDRAAFSPFTGEIKGNRVRLRLAPHTDSFIIKELSKGDCLAVLGESKDYYVVAAPEGVRGYVFRTFVLDNVIEGEKVNVRLEPSTSAPILARLSKGTVVKTLGAAQGKWIEIALPKQCVFYVAKNFVKNVGALDLYNQKEGQKKLALDLLSSAMDFADAELQKKIEDIDLDAIYKKMNLAQSEEFKDVPGLQSLVQKALERVQEAFLAKSLEKSSVKVPEIRHKVLEEIAVVSPAVEETPVVTKTEEQKVTTVPVPAPAVVTEPAQDLSSVKGSLLSHYIRKKGFVKASPVIEGRESFERSLFAVWLSLQPEEIRHQLTMESFYRDEQKKKRVLTGELEVYPHIVKNNPGDYLLKNGEDVVAFVYATSIDLSKWLGKSVVLECVSRPNNHFAFPAYIVLSVKEGA
ncbi:SH3 domain-containing protein [Chlamydia trachomatis]|nr:hypothetical protein DCS63711_00095 [Chlamydia trachomatis D/CS637/11]ROT51187.1 bacterial SH3 domain protein [Chlamydia trachomatis]CCP50184.1 putative carboxyl-terminal-processing protease, deltaproteobacterial [Chlamydia trachomatis K/SotonK1]CCP53093.1 putative carboxyl-terminal-processing protease, deltaproteobacterial [Chlamydia trachomatis D/SotonD5]CCP53984.1 putative carboxyl-terminal-processing protease, deltaproteobacterial [Chlamydia trachomatis D/SotonD6]CCP55768.1 putative car